MAGRSLPGAGPRVGSASPSEAPEDTAAPGGPFDPMLSEPSGPGCESSAPRFSETFGRDRRILRRADYLDTYSSGRRYVGRWLVLFVRPARGSSARLGVTITRKTGSAVVRNRLRRRLRELFRRCSELRAAVDVVVNVRAGAEETSFAELSRDFGKLVARVGAGGSP